METSKSEGSFYDLLRFYIPLAATSVMMMVTHSVVSGAVARTVSPTLALAAYSAAYSVGQVLESPCYGMQRMALAFTQGRKSFAVVGRVGLAMLAFILGILLLIAWTPLSRVVFCDVLGLTEEVYSFAVPSFRVLLVWPAASALRAFYQAIIILQKRTYWTTGNMLMRVFVMFTAAFILPKIWPNGPVGASLLMLGLSTEAVLALVVAKKAIPPLEVEDSSVVIPKSVDVFRFALPLAIAASFQHLAKPFVTASLSRTLNPEVTLAGYQVALSFSYIFVALTYNVYQAVMVFVRDVRSFRRVRSFTLSLGLFASTILVLCSIPSMGNWIFGSIIGTDEVTTGEAIRTLRVLAITPALFSYIELCGGLLMMKKHTVWVTAAKLTNVAITSGVVLVLARNVPSMGAMIGALALAVGALAEMAVLYRTINAIPDCRIIVKGEVGSFQRHVQSSV